MGKGSKRRPTDTDRFDANYDRIDWSKRQQPECPMCQRRHAPGVDCCDVETECIECGTKVKVHEAWWMAHTSDGAYGPLCVECVKRLKESNWRR